MTWSLNRTGHLRLADGSILRLDAELGKYCASFYKAGPQQLVLRAYSYGTFDDMKALVASWADAFEASLLTSPAVGVGERPGAVLDHLPAPGQPDGAVA